MQPHKLFVNTKIWGLNGCISCDLLLGKQHIIVKLKFLVAT